MWNNSQLDALSNLFGRYNAFPTNGREDEFVIIREDGERQGIFKEWASPILPFLSGYEQGEWRAKARQQPAFLEKELRRAWRNSWLIDRDLAATYAAQLLPKDPRRRVSRLVRRLTQSFGLMAPFYHLEAIADDPAWLGINIGEQSQATGELDVAAFLLPSALQQYVVATDGSWNNLNWLRIHQLTDVALADSAHACALLGLAGLLGVPPAHLIFAANALQWIPTRVGGKKEDAGEREAIEELREIIAKSREAKRPDCLSILADANAKIRFFNWLPLIEGPENFEGRNWTYASVCDTADALFETLDAHPELWKPDFREAYLGKLRPQILNLDAASARGRFLLDLIVNERRLANELTGTQTKPYRYRRPGWLIPHATYEFNQPCLVGTKPVGLALATRLLGKEHVLPGLIISMDSAGCRRYKHFADAARASRPDVKYWAVRSSSLDEGTARGVYETILRVPARQLKSAIRTCIMSHNRPGAVAFRQTKGANDLDRRLEIAVLLQPYQIGKRGGVAVVSGHSGGGDTRYQISVARTADQVTSGGKTRELDFSEYMQAPRHLASLVSVLKRLHDVFGGAIQVEWIIDNADKIIILQVEFLPAKPTHGDAGQNHGAPAVAVSVNSLSDIRDAVAQVESTVQNRPVRLVIGPAIDPKSFQGEVFTMVVRLGKRITEISLAHPVSPSSHFANICRHFGITLVH